MSASGPARPGSATGACPRIGTNPTSDTAASRVRREAFTRAPSFSTRERSCHHRSARLRVGRRPGRATRHLPTTAFSPGGIRMVFDHIGFNVSDFGKAKDFLVKALEPLGIGITMEGEGWAMVGRRGEGNLWFGSFGGAPGPIHIAFAAANREQVRRFHAAALAAGGRDNG